MAIDQESFNKKLYDLLKTKGYRPIPKDAKNKRTENPQEADVFNFTFTKNGEEITDAWVTIDDAQDVIVYYDDEVLDSGGRSKGSEFDDSWTGFIQQLKRWAMSKQLGFELREKHKLGDDMAQREYTRKKENISEGYYPMGKQSSYSDNIPTVKIVLQHTRQIQEGEQRFRNIARIFLENQQGERILAPTIRPGVAQVYARHLAEGGLPNDERWNHIKSLCEEYNKMAGFVRATRNGQFNESAMALVTEGVNHYQNLRETLGRMRSNRGYHKYFENYTPTLMETENDTSGLNELFVQEKLDPRIESVLPILSKLHKKLDEMKEVVELDEWATTITELQEPDAISQEEYNKERKKISQIQMLLHAEPNPAKKEQMKKLLAKKLAMLRLRAEKSELQIDEGIDFNKESSLEAAIDFFNKHLADPNISAENKVPIQKIVDLMQERLKQLKSGTADLSTPNPFASYSDDTKLSSIIQSISNKEKNNDDTGVLTLDKLFGIANNWLKVREGWNDHLDDPNVGNEYWLDKVDSYRDQNKEPKPEEEVKDNLGEEQEEKFVIVSTVEKDDETGKPLYWNNDDGWTIKKGATEFSSDEVKRFKDIPMNSKWVKLSGIKENLGPEQKRVGQLGPTEKVKNNNIGKLVGASESAEPKTKPHKSPMGGEKLDKMAFGKQPMPAKTKSLKEDSDEARELELFATNDSDLYRQSYLPIVKNLERKFKKGIYDKELAKKLWVLHAARAAKKYGQEHGNDDGLKIFNTAVRREVADKLAADHFAEMEAGNFHDVVKEGSKNKEELVDVTPAFDALEKALNDIPDHKWFPFDDGVPAKGTVTDKSGAKHSPMSRAKDLAQKGRDSVKEEGYDTIKIPSSAEEKQFSDTAYKHLVTKEINTAKNTGNYLLAAQSLLQGYEMRTYPQLKMIWNTVNKNQELNDQAKEFIEKLEASLNKQGVAEGLNEMDKSQPSSDRGGESSGDPYAKGGKATPVKAKDTAKDAEKELEKSYKKDVKEGQEELDRILKLSGK